jgi:acyl-CoA reductase-like NAD-dependent aldehyde dehydrogenase
MSESLQRLPTEVAALAAGAARHVNRGVAERAALARACARGVAAEAGAWVETAVAIKRGGPEAVAEETATGPLGTLRLLLLTARSLDDIARRGLPRVARPPRLSIRPAAGSSPASWIEVDLLPAGGLWDGVVFRGDRATVRCADPGGPEAFERVWRREVAERPRGGGVTAVLGAGNVTGLAAADCISQVFEHGRAVLLKLHPIQAPLEPIYRRAFAPLVEAGLLALTTGGVAVSRAAIDAPEVTHVHLTGGQAAFDAVVWGGGDPHAAGATPILTKPITCELGNVTPWFVLPGRYTPAQLACQADTIAASIANNTSFNCIATKLVVTCRGWPQRGALLDLVGRRLEGLAARTAWYPGAQATWEGVTGRRPPDDGTLPWVFRRGLDLERDHAWVDREWFGPVAAETCVEADDIEGFCTRAAAIAARLPGTLAAGVTLPETLPPRDRQRADLFVEHLEYGVVAVNGWAAMAYATGCVPWGGFPGATLAAPASGIGHVHDPYLLPLVRNTILRTKLAAWPPPPWFPWNGEAVTLARGLVATYAAIARGGSGLGGVLRMLPAVARSALRPPPPP